MMLQAYIDDSKTHEEVLVLGGYLAHPQRWDQLSIAWRALLQEYPSWREFKMSRAARRPNRVERFAQIIEQHVAAYVACVVEIGALRQLCNEMGLRSDLGVIVQNPYNFAIKAILGATYRELARVGLRWPIKFIFDERGEKVHLENNWSVFVCSMPVDARGVIYGRPSFENSVNSCPLQAAEIIAWRARRHWMEHRTFSGNSEHSWHRSSPVKGHLVHWDYEALKPNIESYRDRLLKWGVLAQ